MMRLALRIAANAIALFIAAFLLPAVTLSNELAALLAGTVLALVNIFVRPLLILITLPVNLISLGLFTLVINAWMVMLTAYIVGGITVNGFWAALIAALMVTLVNMPLNQHFKGQYYIKIHK